MNRKENQVSPISDQLEVFVFFGPIRAVEFKADSEISEFMGNIVDVKDGDTMIDLGFDSSYFWQENKKREDMNEGFKDLRRNLGILVAWLKLKNLKPDTVISGFTNEHMAHVSKRFGFNITEIDLEDELGFKENLALEASNARFWKRKVELEEKKGIPAEIGKTMFCYQRLGDFIKRFDNGTRVDSMTIMERPLVELNQLSK